MVKVWIIFKTNEYGVSGYNLWYVFRVRIKGLAFESLINWFCEWIYIF